ncbi:MAG: Stp1/IreP family PP2C-type Ser/Thr phosphatase [Acetatifactor sp.]|nr:Stp1/IreP family PP2C-type Ser/Thr phosphatase [Acetatifactor sp.]
MKTFSVTNIGKKRKLNQDFVYTSEVPVGHLPNLFIVADGMGGHNAGDYASKLAVETMVEEIALSAEQEPEAVLRMAVEKANAMVNGSAKKAPELEGMGTTIVAASIEGSTLSVTNVGDSRLYVVGGHEIRQITRDHSWVEDMVRSGGMGREEARNHPDKNIITRAVGAEDSVKTDFFSVTLREGDMILMCTDGLTNMLNDEEIRMVLDGARDIVEKAEELVRRANENGGRDNISVILIEPGR